MNAPAPTVGKSHAVCVYCGSSNHVDGGFVAVAQQAGEAIAKRGWSLIYGGGSTGLMGAVARAAQSHGGKVVGVLPRAMTDTEAAYLAADELLFTDTMRQRKHEMDQRADAFLVLPGGFGTLEELSEVITHRYLRFHRKPIVILNHKGFYDPLLTLFDHFIQHGFACENYRKTWAVTATVDEAVAALLCSLKQKSDDFSANY
jgi:hypothetical protein